MADNIFGTRFVGAREPGWHHIGTVISEDEMSGMTVEKALKIGGIDYRYVSLPIGYTLPTGDLVETGSKVAIVREPTPDSPQWVELGFASAGYRYLQNDELAKGLDAISRETGWQFETVGALGDGRTVFLTLKAPDREVFGDKYKTYLIVSDGKVANRALTVAVAPVRVVCQNTLLASDRSATISIKIPHVGDVSGEYGFWLQHVTDMQRAQDAVYRGLERMGGVKISDEEAREVFRAAYPVPTENQRVVRSKQVETMDLADEVKTPILERLADDVKLHEFWKGYANRHVEACVVLYQRFNDGEEQGTTSTGAKMAPKTLKTLRETPYAALQAVTEMADFSGRAGEAVASQSALFGEGARIKRRAWTAAEALVSA